MTTRCPSARRPTRPAARCSDSSSPDDRGSTASTPAAAPPTSRGSGLTSARAAHDMRSMWGAGRADELWWRWPASSRRHCARTSDGPIVSVGAQPRAAEAPCLHDAGGGDPRADGQRRLALALAAQLLVVDTRHVHVDVDPVEQRAGDALLVARDDRRRTGAGFLGVAMIPAGAGIMSKRQF
jgi:hypothetical protein